MVFTLERPQEDGPQLLTVRTGLLTPLECVTSLQSDSWDHLAVERLNRILTGRLWGGTKPPHSAVSEVSPTLSPLSVCSGPCISTSQSPSLQLFQFVSLLEPAREREPTPHAAPAGRARSSRPQGALYAELPGPV